MELNPAYASDSDTASLIRVTGNGFDDADELEATVKPTLRPTMVLDSSGDAILKLGETSIRVSSKVLSVASPVFRAMFRPHFQEGEALSRRQVICRYILRFFRLQKYRVYRNLT